MSRATALLFAIICYAIFFANFLYLIVFVGNFSFATITVDNGPQSPLALAVVVDLALIALFGLQHSVMASPAFKAKWTRIVPPPVERSVYVLAASVALMILFLGWRPINNVVWSLNPITHPVINSIVWLIFW